MVGKTDEYASDGQTVQQINCNQLRSSVQSVVHYIGLNSNWNKINLKNEVPEVDNNKKKSSYFKYFLHIIANILGNIADDSKRTIKYLKIYCA